MFLVQNTINVGLKVEGQEINLLENPFGHVSIRDHMDYHLPTLSFSISDSTKVFEQNPIADGTKIEVYMARTSSDNAEWMPFRVFSKKTSQAEHITVYQVHAYYDAPEYWKTRMIESFDKTASEVFEEVASAAGLVTDIDSTNDRNIWRNTNFTPAQFLQNRVLPNAVSNAESYVRSVVSSTLGGLRLKDLSKVMTDPAKKILKNTDENPSNMIWQYKGNEDAGAKNKDSGGYGLNTTFYSAVNGLIKKTSGLDVRQTLSSLNIGKDLLETTGLSSLHRLPGLNLGNKTDKSNDAVSQNLRQTAMWSSRMEVLLRDFSQLDVLDPLETEIVKEINTGETSSELSGKWVVSGKMVVATFNDFAEKLVLTRNGTDTESENLTS